MMDSTRDSLIQFFGAVLPAPEQGQVFVAATPYPKKNPDDKPAMKQTYAATHEELADAVLQINSQGREAYFALGRYMPHKTDKGNPGRQGEYVRGLKSFWVDIDVGEDKAAAGDGYLTQRAGFDALLKFVSDCGLPEPTHLVNSGAGIHAYLALDRVVTPEEWKPIGTKLKALAAERKFLADPARTADVASVLRPPFTQNHKLDMPRDVKLKHSAPPIIFDEFADAINTAHATHCGAKVVCAIPGTPRTLSGNLTLETPEEIERVKSMLAAIPAGCDRATWRDIIWAVASTGWACAENIARAWSKTAPEMYNEDTFQKTWDSFDPEKEDGVKFGTLGHNAKLHGWNGAGGNKGQSPEWVETINQQFAWIEENASIYRLGYANFIEPAKFKTQLDNQSVSVQSGDNTKTVGAGTAWLKHPKRRLHRTLAMRPQEGLVTDDNCLNEWRGFEYKPTPGDVTTFLQLLERMVPDQKARQYVLSWMAHLLQHPEIKLNVSLAFWSLAQGVGKNLLFECISSIIGQTHACVIGQAELAASFNGWANRKVFVVGDEVSSTNRRQDADKLKGLVTGTTIHINEKFQPGRAVPNFVNFIFLSNHHDALFVGDHDRRFFVWEITAGRLPVEMTQEFVKWRDTGGLSALLHHLLNYDISGFNPKAPAPMTDAKQQMADDNRSDLESWLADLFASGASLMLGREIATAHEIVSLYTNDTKNNVSAKAVTGACKRLGAYARDNQVRLANGNKVRVLALERTDYWKQQPEADWSAEMLKPLKCY